MSIENMTEEMLNGSSAATEEMNEPQQEQQEQSSGGFSLNLGWLKTPTGEGAIEDRLDHPLNPNRSYGVAQILRGVEGFTDSLRLAVLDIGLGIMERMKERKGGAARE